jgi:RHH-type proline utilization regulon transcriptional repressor/proline dehydrogenase/delta 1-pyrroline-5-carboxylate dehydrogenase
VRNVQSGLDWDRIDAGKYRDERQAIADLLALTPFSLEEQQEVRAEAIGLVEAARAASRKQGLVESFLQQFSLGTREGLALMCLAEALLRVPDSETRDRLIAEKISTADWTSHIGKSDSLFVNASTWGLMLTGKLVDVDEQIRSDVGGWLKALVGRLGEPVIRKAVSTAVRMMGNQFVLGGTIESAIERARKEGYRCSFDMLGEGARTIADADRYEALYAEAIRTVGASRAPLESPEEGHGISVKLSALCPRYDAAREAFVFADLYPRVRRLALIAAEHDLNFTIDAEEADRLVLSLKLVDRLARDEALGGWTGLGLVVQAYQKRALSVIDRLAELSRQSGRRLMIRLVKGAYWDSEIKRAQVAGAPGYPVFTTKAATDLSYLVCAARLIEASPLLFPQFATHNAHTLAAVRKMAQRAGVPIEHQRLHGMGEALYQSASRANDVALRAYAPVGGHEELLPYLVRRLLENGANSSFVHALLDEKVPPADVVGDPIDAVRDMPTPHPRIPLPADIYGPQRRNPLGRDYSIAAVRETAARAAAALSPLSGGPIVGGQSDNGIDRRTITGPVRSDRIIGDIADASGQDIDRAAALALAAQPGWDRLGGGGRASILRAMGDALESEMDRLIALLSREGGKTLNDGVAEVREAIDFCRYYALLAERQFGDAETLQGPVGETNSLALHGRGIFACISPWNFPLAIFTGQIAAALAAGNAVLAKPAEQTVLVAAEAVRLFHRAGLDPDLLSLLPGDGAVVGSALCRHPLVQGVAFTGGTETARAINLELARRPGPIVPLIAETGGLNGMFCDSTALREQVVDDVLLSAFGSAGQRCSALRLLYIPKDTADDILATIAGALATWTIGDPSDPATDIGPVIDEDARAMLQRHVERLEREASILVRADDSGLPADGCYFAPIVAEIPTPDFLESEVFGPILHVYRYEPGELEMVADRLAARGYGLTLGIHSRLEGFARRVRRHVPAGNVYVNRSITGAVVGVQPFGGEGLSGTGPKAGGPHALLRYATERALSVNITAQGGDPALLSL